MSLVTYDLLLADKATDGSIRNWVRSDAVPPLTILRMSENWIAQRLRIRQMIESSNDENGGYGVLSFGQTSIDVPDRCLAVKSFRIVIPYDYALIPKTFEELQELTKRQSDGTLQATNPEHFAFLGSKIYFDSQMAENLSYEMIGIYALPPLSQDNRTNYLTDQALSLLMMACAGFASEYMNEPEESQRWLLGAAAEIQRINATHAMDQRGTFQAVRVA